MKFYLSELKEYVQGLPRLDLFLISRCARALVIAMPHIAGFSGCLHLAKGDRFQPVVLQHVPSTHDSSQESLRVPFQA